MFNILKLTLCNILFCLFFITNTLSDIIKKINVVGNERVSSETIKMFSKTKIDSNINQNDLNNILKNIYDSNFFEDVSVNLENNTLIILVKEYPVIQNIEFNGIKAKKYREPILKKLKLKSRASFNKILLEKDKDLIISSLKDFGFYFSNVDVAIENLNDNKINISYNIELGNKAKIKKIKFIGNKVFKDKKLKNIIISEEFKFWKFVSGKKFLNENLISLDVRLLKNYYLNKGYYNVNVNSSFAKLVDEDKFELIYNINANDKIFFNELELIIPEDYDRNNFLKLDSLLDDYEGKIYSLSAIENILQEIDKVTLNEQYSSIKASVDEDISKNKMNLKFIIEETEKFYVEKINIFGNNVTRENVIRNQFEIDEGDPFNEILQNKTLNNLKALNFFKNVSGDIRPGKEQNTKIINISVEEKATGEISAGAGVGTSGGSFSFGVKENNFLGKGIGINSNLTVSGDSIKGLLSLENPNFLDSNKSVSFGIEALEYDNLKNFGYKTNKTGFSVNTNFEYFSDVYLGLGTSNFYEKIETDATASTRQKSQEGNYFDSFLRLSLDYDKRNQKFQTSDGFKSYYSLNLPVISKTNTLSNTYSYNYYTELFEKNISTFSLYFKNATSITDDDVKLSERLYVPSKKLRGFEIGRVGPKDGSDFVGGNTVAAVNISTTMPQVLENSQNTDFLIFMDIANIWGVDYDDTIDGSNKIRSSIGLGVDWFTPIGPLNFSLAYPVTKSTNDVTESFRFNLGTTF